MNHINPAYAPPTSHFLKIPRPFIIFHRLILAWVKQRTYFDAHIRKSYSNGHSRVDFAPYLFYLKAEVDPASKTLQTVWQWPLPTGLVMIVTNVCLQINLKCCRFLPAPKQTATITSCNSRQ
jgi:hypothetical protein